MIYHPLTLVFYPCRKLIVVDIRNSLSLDDLKIVSLDTPILELERLTKPTRGLPYLRFPLIFPVTATIRPEFLRPPPLPYHNLTFAMVL